MKSKFFSLSIGVLIFISGLLSSAQALELKTRGIMAFGFAKNFSATPAFELDYVSGFTAYATWAQIEPEKGQFDFRYFDALLKKAALTGKIVNIGIYPGSQAPSWIFEKYSDMPSISWRHPLKEDQERRVGSKYLSLRSPLPWDDRYLQEWFDLLRAVATRYADHPNVGYIALTGPTVKDLSMGLVFKSKEDRYNLEKMGFTKSKMKNAWIRTIDMYGKLFPNKKWDLAVAPLFPATADLSLSREVSAYLAKNYPRNALFMAVFLNDTWFESGGAAIETRALLKQLKRSGCDIGYQMAQSAYRNARWNRDVDKRIVKSLRRSLSNGLSDGAEFIEVWHDDLIDPRSKEVNNLYSDDVKWAAAELKRR